MLQTYDFGDDVVSLGGRRGKLPQDTNLGKKMTQFVLQNFALVELQGSRGLENPGKVMESGFCFPGLE